MSLVNTFVAFLYGMILGSIHIHTPLGRTPSVPLQVFFRSGIPFRFVSSRIQSISLVMWVT